MDTNKLDRFDGQKIGILSSSRNPPTKINSPKECYKNYRDDCRQMSVFRLNH